MRLAIAIILVAVIGMGAVVVWRSPNAQTAAVILAAMVIVVIMGAAPVVVGALTRRNSREHRKPESNEDVRVIRQTRPEDRPPPDSGAPNR
ncbi:MAG: hypothetical protein KF745_09305 [Phycisphaeraceae bacterium]|nr:hypothetical protein [Phycisphaeraceae bacterium]